MPARVRARLTYANVVATLALFIALGGTGYAASQITSRDVKNRSLKGGDLKRNTLTGKEIDESKMGIVPNARSSRNSLTAASATVADLSRNSDRATTAALADAARDAQALAGQGAASFEQSSTVQFGRAPATPAGPPNEQALLSWPELGAQLTTSFDQCGGGGNASFAVKSTKGAGGGNLDFFDNGNGAGTVAPGATARDCSSSGTDSVDAEISDASGRTLFVDCVEAGGELRCLGVRSEP